MEHQNNTDGLAAVIGDSLTTPDIAGGQMTHTASAVNKAYPNADPAVVARNNAEINAAVAAAEKPKLVRHLLQQRIDEALFEAKRLQTQLDEAPAALLDCTLEQAQKIFG